MRLPDLLPVAEAAVFATTNPENNDNSVILLSKTADKFVSDALRSNTLEDRNRKIDNSEETFKVYSNSNNEIGYENNFGRHMNGNKNGNNNYSYNRNLENSLQNENNFIHQHNQNLHCDSPLSSEKSQVPRGIINPNYPGFEMFAHALSDYFIKNYGYCCQDSDINYKVCYNNNPNKHDDFKSQKNARQVKNSNTHYYDCTSLENNKNESHLNRNNQQYLLQDISSLEQKSVLIEPNRKFLKNDNRNGHEINDKLTLDLNPTSIVGDFRKEMEFELGVHMANYNETQDDIVQITKFHDAKLSNATEAINSNINLQMLNQPYKNSRSKLDEFQPSKNLSPNLSAAPLINECSLKFNSDNGQFEDIKYQKFSHDDRQLPPVIIEYKRCPRISTKYEHTTFKNHLVAKQKANKTNMKNREESEITQYQEIVSNKESILQSSRYTKLSSWAKYLENIVKEKNTKNRTNFLTPTALELFDAYKIQSDIGIKEFENHFQLATEIEIKRRNDREQIRKRLAMDAETKRTTNQCYQNKKSSMRPPSTCKGESEFSDFSSESDSHSSESEYNPKIFKRTVATSLMNINNLFDHRKAYNLPNNQHSKIFWDEIDDRKGVQRGGSNSNGKMNKCDIFAKQTKLQVEVRTALAQSAQIAQMQMQMQKKNQGESPLTKFIRKTCDKTGITLGSKGNRVSRQMLTKMKIPQLQFLFYSFNIYFENLNEMLVKFLIERDDLQATQNIILFDIKEISRYIGTNEQRN